MKVSRFQAKIAGCFLIGLAFTTVFASLGETRTTQPPVVMSAAAPVYPPSAAAASAAGEVVVEVSINAAGVVVSAQSLSGHALLRKASETAARSWEFTPAESKTSTRTARLTFVYRLPEKGDAGAGLSAVFRPPFVVEVRPPALVEKVNN